MSVIEIVFWTGAAFLAWTYGGYPVALAVVAPFRKRIRPGGRHLPAVSLILVPHRRDPLLERRLRALAALDYPPHRLEILIGAGGDDDSPIAEMVRAMGDPRFRTVRSRTEAVAAARHGILAFADPNSLPQAGCLRALVQPLADPRVGVVCGNRVHIRSRGDDCTLHAERLYSDWDKWIRALESRAASVVAPDRGPWAVRRELYAAAPAGRDARLETAAAAAAAGLRILWTPSAIAWERGGDAEVRFDSRVRATRARIASLRAAPGILFRHGGWSFVLTWHLLARFATPVALAALLLSSVLLTGKGLVYEAAAVLQCLFYGAAALGWLARDSRLGRIAGFCVPYFVCLGWAAAVAALAPRRAASARRRAAPGPTVAPAAPPQPWTTGRPPA